MTTAKYADIADGFFYADSSGPYTVEAYLSLERGTVHVISEDDLGLDEVPEDLETGPYLALPCKSDLDLGHNLVHDFIREQLPDAENVVFDIFRKRGAYGRFKDFLDRRGKLQAWYDYEEAATEARLRQWCADNDIELT